MVKKSFVICFCYLFWTWPCTTFNSIPIILNLLTNRNIALVYSVTIYEQKTKDCARLGSFQHKLHHHCFQFWCLPAFLTSLRLLTMVVLIPSSMCQFQQYGAKIAALGSDKITKHDKMMYILDGPIIFSYGPYSLYFARRLRGGLYYCVHV